MVKKSRHFCISIIARVQIDGICSAQVFHDEIYLTAQVAKFKQQNQNSPFSISTPYMVQTANCSSTLGAESSKGASFML